jgi:bifunctional UDP-N-acetylglucosamine pyrophosphorylase/glucosamine-1-phosphate N-acetyltransferase
MQAVILAAGEGTRVYPLTKTKAKPSLKVLGKSIIEYNLEALSGLVKEVILVIGYKGEDIEKNIGSNFGPLKIKYVWKKEILGTADAAKEAKDLIKDKFLLLNGDDIYSKEDIKKCLKTFPSILLAKVEDPSRFGVVSIENDSIKDIAEKPENPSGNLVNTGLYFLDKSIFDFEIEKSQRNEYEFTDLIKNYIQRQKLYFQIAEGWIPLSFSWNLLDLNEFLLKKAKGKKQGKIEKYCTILGNVIIEKGAEIKSGTYIEGPAYIGKNSKVGPNSYIRAFTCVGDNCRIGQAVEVKNSIIGDGSHIAHLSYVGDSIIGSDCNFGAGTIAANLRFDSKTIKSEVKGKVIDTGRRKFGCVIGDDVKTGINVSIMPGILIGKNSVIYPNSLIERNLPDDSIFNPKASN